MNRKKWYLVIGAALMLAGFFTAYSIHSQRNLMKEQAMMFELKQLRSAVQFYAKSVGHNPPDLKTAMVKLESFKDTHWSMDLAKTGDPRDPFGNIYQYTASSGWVKSATPGYESW